MERSTFVDVMSKTVLKAPKFMKMHCISHRHRVFEQLQKTILWLTGTGWRKNALQIWHSLQFCTYTDTGTSSTREIIHWNSSFLLNQQQALREQMVCHLYPVSTFHHHRLKIIKVHCQVWLGYPFGCLQLLGGSTDSCSIWLWSSAKFLCLDNEVHSF